jgi:signal transduction histidine kinase
MKSLSHVFGNTLETTVTDTENVSLHYLVDRLMESFIPLAVSKHSFIINDVDARLKVQADEQMLAFIVGNMMINVINSSRSACVRIEAIKKPNGIQLRISNNGQRYYSTVFTYFGQAAA